MNERNQLLPLDQITVGMELAEAIRDRLGNIMLPEGVSLTGQHLHSLAQRGIATALIKVGEPPMTKEEQQKQIQAIKEHLDQIFRLSQDNPLNQELKALILTYRMEQFD
jgi:hypothetical protein